MRRFFSSCIALTCLLCLCIPFTACAPAASQDESEKLASMKPEQLPAYLGSLDREDLAARYYRNEKSRVFTLSFFGVVAGSETIARAILDNCARYDVPPSLAFALAYEESRYKSDAFNRNIDASVDRGLFQLNSKSFPGLSLADFYDIEENARNGIAHLKFCLDHGGNEVTALAMYNAGRMRVSRDTTPRRTLGYVSRILKYQENIENLFEAKALDARARKNRGALALGQIVW